MQKAVACVILIIAGAVAGSAAALPAPMWLPGAEKTKPDTYAAFRGHFTISDGFEVEFRHIGATWYTVYLDGELLAEGPPRYPKTHPEYDTCRRRLAPGKHVIAARVHYEGVTTRILADIPPFFACEVLCGDRPVNLNWKCIELPGHKREVRRINPQFGWMEWIDTREVPWDWRLPEFNDTEWGSAANCDPGIGSMEPLSSASVHFVTLSMTPAADGLLAETYGYEFDDVPARFQFRDLNDKRFPAQGVWRRYDLGRVHIGRPRIELDLPAGAVIEMAYNENLMYGRVSPYITLSAGTSCHMDHYIARGGKQEFYPNAPRGMRYVEVHVLANPAEVKFLREEFIESAYHDEPAGSFRCDDDLLNRIWATGVSTCRASTKDALVDSIREQGQWTGDVVSSGMDIAASAYPDIRLIRRAILQSAQCARPDGLVAGLCPGGCEFLATYSAQWISACIHYYELTGDREFLDKMHPYAIKNLRAFESRMDPAVKEEGLGWVFIDWGYVPNAGPVDIAFNLHFLAALRDMIRWDTLFDKKDDLAKRVEQEKALTQFIARWFDDQLKSGDDAWKAIGYHRAALGLRMGFFSGDSKAKCIQSMKDHILSCFPNNPTAPRLSDPAVADTRLITPYFANYAFPPLIENGEIEFVLDQYRKCWGWPLNEGLTTWPEVFDLRWSHCHCWSGCPTWQLSRYALGIHPRFDLGRNHYLMLLIPGSLKNAAGDIPISGTDKTIQVQWTKSENGSISYTIQSPVTIYLHNTEFAEPIEIKEKTTFDINIS